MSFKALIYVSKRPADLDDASVDAIVQHAEMRNAERDITGIILVKDKYFLQFIEGPEANIDDLYALLEKDVRHFDLRVLYDDFSEKRIFPTWCMFRLTDPEDFLAGSELLESLGNTPLSENLGEFFFTNFSIDRLYRPYKD